MGVASDIWLFHNWGGRFILSWRQINYHRIFLRHFPKFQIQQAIFRTIYHTVLAIFFFEITSSLILVHYYGPEAVLTRNMRFSFLGKAHRPGPTITIFFIIPNGTPTMGTMGKPHDFWRPRDHGKGPRVSLKNPRSWTTRFRMGTHVLHHWGGGGPHGSLKNHWRWLRRAHGDPSRLFWATETTRDWKGHGSLNPNRNSIKKPHRFPLGNHWMGERAGGGDDPPIFPIDPILMPHTHGPTDFHLDHWRWCESSRDHDEHGDHLKGPTDPMETPKLLGEPFDWRGISDLKGHNAALKKFDVGRRFYIYVLIWALMAAYGNWRERLTCKLPCLAQALCYWWNANLDAKKSLRSYPTLST